MAERSIFVGIGGWTFEPWRGTFYPADLPHASELAYASRRLTAIEVNGTYYATQKPSTFAKWRDETPDGFKFSLKAHRFTTNRKVLAEAGDSVAHFVGSGIAQLRDKLGPLVWQLAPSKRFDATDVEAFFRLLPREVDGLRLRHALDPRHESFRCAQYVDLARDHDVATVFTDSDDYPPIADVTSDFVYTRMMRTRVELAEGCTGEELAGLASCAKAWRDGTQPDRLPLVLPADSMQATARDVFMFFISGAKERAPAAACGLLGHLG